MSGKGEKRGLDRLDIIQLVSCRAPPICTKTTQGVKQEIQSAQSSYSYLDPSVNSLNLTKKGETSTILPIVLKEDLIAFFQIIVLIENSCRDLYNFICVQSSELSLLSEKIQIGKTQVAF